MLPPATASRYDAVLSVMQSITTWQQRQTVKQQQNGQPSTPSIALLLAPSPARTQAKEAVNQIFSASYVTPTQLMVRMVDRVVDYLDDKLSANASQADDTPDAMADKRQWISKALQVDDRVSASAGMLSIPKPVDDDRSFRQVANMILNMFNGDYLAGDTGLKKDLEDIIGFSLGTVSALDVLKAVVDPSSEAATKVDKVLTNGLAGQKGSKVAQRLDRAAEGPQTVDEAVDHALHKSMTDEVDSETQAEDRKAIADAVSHDKLDKIEKLQDQVADAAKKTSKGAQHGDEDTARQATEIVSALAATGEAADAQAQASDTVGTAASADTASTGADTVTPSNDKSADAAGDATTAQLVTDSERKAEAEAKALSETVRGARAAAAHADNPAIRAYREATSDGATNDRERHLRAAAA